VPNQNPNKKLKETITINKPGGEVVVLDVKYPSGKNYQEAQKIYAAAWRQAVEADVILKDQLEDFLKSKNLWDKEKEAEKLKLFKEIGELDRKLAAGKMTYSAGKAISLEMLKKRNELRSLLERRSNLEAATAEALAENTRFNYLVSVCVVSNKTGDPYFKDLDEYMEKMTEPEAYESASKLASMIYSLDSDPDAGRREIKFLKKYKMMNDKGQLIREDGKAVDEDGRLINEENRYINEDGEFVDIDGNRINEDGSPAVPEPEFYPDDAPPSDQESDISPADLDEQKEKSNSMEESLQFGVSEDK
jgi:hypothetical protein